MAMKPKFFFRTSHLGREAAQKAVQVKDLGFQAVLEKMNSLNAPQFSGPFGNISKIFEKNWLICQSSLPHEIQLKLTLVNPSADFFFAKL